MPEIRILPDQVANQIAAGEVVERPASVVKELLENSLDAGATRVNVEFRHGGKALLVVEDNGCGMSPDQALLALEPHATSKIRLAADLNEIRTFGFRGEALPSIASVSRFLLRTRPADAVSGSEVLVNAGKLIHQKETGMAPGTRIEVANLFHPVPARLKFLKSENTEAAHITRLVRLYAVAQPQVGFLLTEDGEEVFRSPASTTLLDRVREIWGKQLAADLVPMALSEAPGMKVWGLLGKPGVGRATRQEMVTIVNGRPVDSRTLAYALVESYHTLLPKGRYPLAFLFFEVDPHCVDVNVHPSKKEVRFREESRVRQFVIRAVLQHFETLLGTAPQVSVIDPPVSRVIYPENPTAHPDEGRASATPAFPQGGAPAEPARDLSGKSVSSENPVVPPSPGREPVPAAASFRLDWRLAGHLRDGVFLFETDSGLVVLNLKSARERIWYERILRRFDEHENAAQRLLLPVPLELEPIAASILRERLKMLQDVGFEIEEFGRNFFRILSVPDWLAEAETEMFIRDIVAEMGRRPGEFQREHLAHESLARMASTRAGRSGESSSDTVIIGVVQELFQCLQPTVCPRGKPVFFEISRSEIARKLGG
ncbi:MAG: DNA mismatch repair endonuclease MutL [Puniceicoccales bacterium]|jgi:DNA mismatch repair protein MutL|nr:DNA mismatch repair endonuclease MutL [Puniceicoccales bacterium]